MPGSVSSPFENVCSCVIKVRYHTCAVQIDTFFHTDSYGDKPMASFSQPGVNKTPWSNARLLGMHRLNGCDRHLVSIRRDARVLRPELG